MMAITTAATVYGTVKTAQAQKQAAEERGKQAQSQAKAATIKRLKAMRAVMGENIARSAAGGLTLEGTPSQILEGNIKKAEYDIAMIKGGADSAVRGYKQAGKEAMTAGMISAVGSLASGAAQIASVPKSPTMPSTTTQL